MWMRRCYTYYVAIYLWVSSQSWYCPWVQSISNFMLVVLLKLRLGCRKVVKWSLSLPKTSLGGVVYTSSTHAWVGLSGILARSQGRIWSDYMWQFLIQLKQSANKMGKTKPGIVLGTMEVQVLAPNKWCYECKRGVLVAHLVLLIKESPPSLVGAPASTRCQKRWSSLASPPPLPPPPMVASSSTGWTLLTCTQEGRCEEKLPFDLSDKTSPSFCPYMIWMKLGLNIAET